MPVLVIDMSRYDFVSGFFCDW